MAVAANAPRGNAASIGLLASLMLPIVLLAAFTYHKPMTGADYFAAAQTAIIAHHESEAYTDLLSAKQLGLDTAISAYERALILGSLNRDPEAVDALTSALWKNAHGDATLSVARANDARSRRGSILFTQEQWKRAKPDLLAASAAYPRDAEIWYQLGMTRLKLGDFPGAMPDLVRANALKANDPRTLLALGRAAVFTDHYSQGVTLLNQAMRLPHVADLDPDAKFARGHGFIGLRDFGRAESDFRWLNEREKSARSWASLCTVHSLQSKYMLSNADCHAALKIDPHYDYMHETIGTNDLFIGDYRASRPELELAIRENPRDQIAHINLGMVDCKQGKFRAAILEYRLAHALDPNDKLAAKNLKSLTEFISYAQKHGAHRYNVSSIDLNGLQGVETPNALALKKMSAPCSAKFGASGTYFNECVDRGVAIAQRDKSEDDAVVAVSNGTKEDPSQQIDDDITQQANRQQEEENTNAYHREYSIGGYYGRAEQEESSSTEEGPGESQESSGSEEGGGEGGD